MFLLLLRVVEPQRGYNTLKVHAHLYVCYITS